MNRETTQPFNFASLSDLQRSLLIQIRRFNRACSELGALTPISLAPISLGPLKNSTPITKTTNKGNKSLEQIELLRNQLRLLRNMRGQLFTSFSNDPKAKKVRQQIEELIADIGDRLDNVQEQVSNSNSEKINPGVKRITNAVIRELQQDLKLKEDQIGNQYFIGLIAAPNTSEANINAEIAYITMKNIKSVDGYANEKFAVAIGFPSTYTAGSDAKTPLVDVKKKTTRAVTAPDGGIVSNKKEQNTTFSHIYIALLTDFKIPSKIRWDAVATKTGDVKKIIHDLLEHHGIVSASEKRSLPVPAESINLSHNNILKTDVKGDAVEVTVKNKNMLQQTADELIMQLRSIFAAGNPKNKDLIRTKLMRDTGVIRFVVSLPARLKGRIIDNNVLQKLKSTLNLTQDEVLRIKTALEDHE